MGKKRGLGHISPDHAMANSILQWFDGNNLSGSAISQVFEARLDIVEDDQQALSVSLGNEINRAQAAEAVLSGNITALSSSISSSIAALSASIGASGGINVDVPGDAELYFNGDTLMTNADVYISGSGNNLYLHGTNNQGIPAKFEFTIISGSTMISEVAHSDFGTEIDDPWFKFDGDTLLTHADIYVSGSNNYLYLNGTDDNGDYGVYYFDIVSGSVYIKQSGSV